MNDTDIRHLLRAIDARHGATFTLIGTCVGGTHGAYEVADATGQRAILKFGTGPGWHAQIRRLGSLMTRLHAVGYPTPRLLCQGVMADGTCYAVQDFVAGVPMTALTPANLDLLLDLNDRQANLHLDTDQDWSAYVRRVVFAGESGWAARLREHSPATVELLAALETITAPYADVALPMTDLVHGDFLPDNVLVDGERVTAVIDIAAAGCGTRAIDLARLLVWCDGDLDGPQRRRLSMRISAIAGIAGRTLCVVEQILDQAAYVIEHHAAQRIDQVIRTDWRILADLRSDD